MEQHEIIRHTVSRETFAAADQLIEDYRSPLETYLEQLMWWNERVNLVSRDVSRGTVWEHIRHSLILSQFEAFKQADFVVDAGTGGGLPGIPLAVTASEKQFLLNDIVSKKIIAIRQILLKLGLENARGKARSIHKLEMRPSSLLISKHAFKINELWQMVREKPWESMIFYKGIEFEDELEGIDEPLKIELFDLSEESDFYNGKALLFAESL